MACFPLLCWQRTSKKKSKNSTQENAGKLKPQDGRRIWPGDDLSKPDPTPVVDDTRDPAAAEQDSKTGVYDSSWAGMGTSSFASKILPTSEASSSSSSRSSVGAREDWEEKTICGEEQSRPVASKYVEDWVNNLKELVHDEVDCDDGDQATTLVSKSLDEREPAEATARESGLNSIVVRSLSQSASTAHLSGLGLQVMPFLGAFNNLESLSLSGNSIVRIPPGCLPRNLQVLDLSKNKIPVIDGLRSLMRLQILNLSYNRISRIGHGLGHCTSIRMLYLVGNKISRVEGLHRLRKLFQLDLSGNRLTTTKSIQQLAANGHSLQDLNLVDNPVLVNLGEEQLRRFINNIAPHVGRLNKQPIKPVPLREAAVGRLARTASSAHSRKARKSGLSKAKRVESLQQSVSSRHRRRRYF